MRNTSNQKKLWIKLIGERTKWRASAEFWKHERLTKQPPQALRPVCEMGIGPFFID
jgi:hypothetical protein